MSIFLESHLWSRIVKKLFEEAGEVSRHEDMLLLGVPDTSYSYQGVNGWIELKRLPSWPLDCHRPVLIPHLTFQQQEFLYTRGRAGGHCFMALSVGTKEDLDFLLIPWPWIFHMGQSSKIEMISMSCLTSRGKPDKESFLHCIKEF